MVIFYGLAIMLAFIVVLGTMQSLGESRLGWIFPVISVGAVLFFLARCMFVAPTHH